MTTFHLGDILTHILGRQFSTNLLAIVDHVHGERVPARQLPAAMTATAAHLREAFPELAELTLDPVANRAAFLAEQVARFGEQHEVRPIPAAFALTATTKEF